MTLYEAKQNINQLVLVSIDYKTKKQYLLTAIIARNRGNDWEYTAEITDVNKNSCSIVTLEELEVQNAKMQK